MMDKIEKQKDKEYEDYIERLKKKTLFVMNYDELSDLAHYEFEKACDEQSFERLRTSMRLMMLVFNIIQAKAEANQTILLPVARDVRRLRKKEAGK